MLHALICPVQERGKGNGKRKIRDEKAEERKKGKIIVIERKLKTREKEEKNEGKEK